MPDINKAQVGGAFDRAAGTYDAMARFQHQVCDRLATTLPEVMPLRLLDGGCGTGYGASLLRQRWPTAWVVGCDLAPEMLRKAAARGLSPVCGDLERLPFADAGFDLVWSSLALQWCQPELAFAQAHRVLSPGGMLVFSTLGPGTLHELESAFSGIDAHRRVLPFVSLEKQKSALAGAGFNVLDLKSESWVTRHADFRTLLGTIRGIGANQIGPQRRQGLMGKSAWRAAQARYETLRDAQGLLPASYSVILGLAQKPP